MTTEVQIALVNASPLIIAAILAPMVTLITSVWANGKLNHITTLTNSTLSAATAQIAALESAALKDTVTIAVERAKGAQPPSTPVIVNGDVKKDSTAQTIVDAKKV